MPRTPNTSGKPTLSSMISETSRRLVWLKRVKRLAGGFVMKNVELDDASLVPPAKDAEQVIVFNYVGDEDDEKEYNKTMRSLENKNNIRFNGGNVTFVSDGKVKVVVSSSFAVASEGSKPRKRQSA